jgi:hypothetical protein
MVNNTTNLHIKMDTDRIINITVTIILILFTSILAPKLPKSITKYFENVFVLFMVLIGITYFATRDVMGALIAIIALAIIYQSIIVNKISDNIIKGTKDIICNNKAQSSNKIINIPTVTSRPLGMDDLSHLIPNDSTLKPNVSTKPKQYVTLVQNRKIPDDFNFDSVHDNTINKSSMNTNIDSNINKSSMNTNIDSNINKSSMNTDKKRFNLQHNTDIPTDNKDFNLQHNTDIPSDNKDFNLQHNDDNLVIDNIFNYGKNNFNNHIIDNISGFDDSNYESF